MSYDYALRYVLGLAIGGWIIMTPFLVYLKVTNRKKKV